MRPKICKRCLYSEDHPLGLVIDEEGVCSGCRIHEEKDILDWDHRGELLKKIVKPYRSNKKYEYDCIVPVTGGNDSYFIMHIVKNHLKLNPLMVTYNKYFNTPIGIRNLAQLRSTFNSDILFQNVNPVAVKNITRETIKRFGSIYWHCLAGQSVFPVQTSVRYKIPLIIWGAHQGMEQVGMFSHENEVEMTRRYRKNHDLMGFESDDLLNISNRLKEEDIWQYRYPNDQELNANSTRGIYLGNYIRWDPKAQHELMIKLYNYRTCNFSRTFDKYDYVDCFNYMDVHDFLKLCKHGYSKVTDHACREIRHKRLSRSNAIQLVKKYEIVKPQFLDLFAKWLDIRIDSFEFIFNQFRNKKFWKEDEPSRFKFKGLSSYLDDEINISDRYSKINFIENDILYNHSQRNYIIFGKGYPFS